MSWLSESVVVLVLVSSNLFACDCETHVVSCDGCFGFYLLLFHIHEQVGCSNTEH
jgi:hypothetical protein